jgi:hypothetical protein
MRTTILSAALLAALAAPAAADDPPMPKVKVIGGGDLPKGAKVVGIDPNQPADTGQVTDPTLRAELVRRMKAEQDARIAVMRVAPPNQPLSAEDRKRPDVQAAFDAMAKTDRDNRAWLKGVVEKRGWPRKSAVGADGALAAFLIAQHAADDLDFMAKCLGLIKAAYQDGQAEGQWVALMTDRLLVLKEKKKQLYGTQLMAQDGKLVPQPIEDEGNVDRRRKELGLPPLADYLKVVNDRPKAPPKSPPGKAGAPPKD